MGRIAVLRVAALLGLAGLAPDTLAATPSAAPAPAREYPQRPIRIIDGFPAGGGTDFLARVIAQKLTERLGQSVVVDNRPGAAGNIGADLAAKATADGHTLLMGLTSILAPSATLYPKLPYRLLGDFAYVTLVASGTYILVIHPAVPAKSVTELIALAKARPGQLSYGSSGVAGPLHLAVEILKSRTGADFLHVPYKGAAPVVAAVTAGEVQLGFASVAAALPLIKAGRLTALAVTSAKRARGFPDLGTIAEAGFPGFDLTPWYGLMAPAATPRAIVGRLNAEVGKVLQLAEVDSSFATQGLEASSSTPERFRQVMQAEVEQWARVIRDANIKAE